MINNLMSIFTKTKQNNTTNTANTTKQTTKAILPRSLEDSYNYKCEQFFGKNWKYIAFFLALSILAISYSLVNISNAMDELKKIVFDNNSKVVLTTTDGRAIKVTKTPLKAEYLKQFALSTYVNNFIVSRSQLTKNFETIEFKNYTEIFDNVPQLKNIYVNFIDSKKPNLNKQAIGDFRAYVQWLISAVAQDKLPEFIAIKDYSVNKYEYENNTFDIEISIKIVAQSYILSQDKYINQNGTFNISSRGSFDLTKSTDVNPYGLRIEKLKVHPVQKSKE